MCDSPLISPQPDSSLLPFPISLLRDVQGATGLDFSGYRQSSLARRVQVRMRQVGMADVRAYAAFCEATPDECAALAQAILIPVTGFFRDAAVWDAVADQALPRLSLAGGPLRVWCAGCASGEEAYTLAMLLAEAVAPGRPAGRVSLLATDVSAPTLEHARRGVYSEAQIADVPPRRRDAWFARTAAGWQVRPALRDAVRFERHDLARDPAPGCFNLISCRNTLMYFAPARQEQALARLAHALQPGGCLLLGRAEGIPPHIAGWTPLDRAQRLYARQHQETETSHSVGDPGDQDRSPETTRLRKSVVTPPESLDH